MTTTALTVSAEPWYLAGWSKHISPSSLGRAAACIRSEAMPHSHTTTPAATKGTIVHKFLADCLDHGFDTALGMVEDTADIDWLSCIPLEKLPAFERDAYAAEVAIAYDPSTRTAREVGRNISRQEARKRSHDNELVGIIDVLGVTEDAAVVSDYKSGWGYVEPAEVNWQLRTYSLIASRYLGKTRSVYSVIRVRDNGSVWSDVATMDEFDLLVHEDELLALLARREDVRQKTRDGAWGLLPAVVEGKHCRYCPALPFCPAKTSAVLDIVKHEDLEGLRVVNELTPELAAVAWRKIRHAQKTLERLESIVKEFARQTPVPLGEGEVLGEKLQPKTTIVAERARAALERVYGPLGIAVAGEATRREETISQERLRAALKKLILPSLPPAERKISWLEKDVKRLFKESGAISVTVTRPVTEHVPKAEEPVEEAA